MSIGEKLQQARAEMSVSRLVTMLMVAAATVAAWLAAGNLADIKAQLKEATDFNRAALVRFATIDGRNDLQDKQLQEHDDRLKDQRRQIETAQATASQAKSEADEVRAWRDTMYPPMHDPRRAR